MTIEQAAIRYVEAWHTYCRAPRWTSGDTSTAKQAAFEAWCRANADLCTAATGGSQ